ncbi:diacylglycerol kinase catalytic region [Beutenbergia cavernae DSM 12333]|uniref:Diacylglycerol kinase catalytic region n=1 Tax=Beutenbergia cavernae (strain ATCC BAA-8 / DSM 12333 / CCUG 43141 / JCM 11478 / NBRC 16432 / NCIMB 13614 / HKI 0122) TaxID=471853 RepID=C5BWI4_BEUC1|nr:diacylglycerol kinase family protein [Beutenbergia cavernae]ACQ78642.1 diacylglycerol kinase catalytic region [Beutenbergia cavernae DSM 12333]
MAWEQIVALAAIVLALAAIVVGVLALRRLRAAGDAPGPAPRAENPRADIGPAAFVINPVKVDDPARIEHAARTISAELGMPEPLLYRTTVEDPGVGQARAALDAGASVVVAAGGDGTVRAVATALAGTGTPMGLLPSGTGNLLARNLDLPVDGADALIRTALAGRDVPVDLGWLTPVRLRTPDEEDDDADAPDVLTDREEHLFLVMAGIGFDAAMVAGADDDLKARMGWMAYFLAGVRHLHGRKIRLEMRIGDAEPRQLKLRSLLFANCGRLPGGIVLLPDAEIDDGLLDVAAIDTRGGLIGWASLFGKVVLQGVGVRGQLAASPGRIDFFRGADIEVRMDQAEQVQVDGDLLGEAIGVRTRVQPGGLRVRVRG